MATLAITFPTGSYAGANMRKLAAVIHDLAASVPDNNPTGAAYSLTFDNAPAGGQACTVTIAGGPYLPATTSRTCG